MSRIRIVHRSGYDYEPWAMASHNEVRMAPKSTHEQLVLSHKIEISPTAWQHAYSDYWGTHVLAFEIHEKHPRLSIVATSEIDVARPDDVEDKLGWEDLTDPALLDSQCEFLDPTPATDVTDFLSSQVGELKAASASPGEFVRTAQGLLSGQITPLVGSHNVQGAAQAWTSHSGLCQDITHVVLGALRLAGIPARYVTGYTVDADSPELGVPHPGSTQSWLQYWDGRWVGLDPLTGRHPDDLFIEVGQGRDYYDVPPLTGIFTGGRTASMFVEVLVIKLS